VPIASAISFVKSLLDDIGMPAGLPSLAAYIISKSPDPNQESSVPTCYILRSDGPEKRLSMTRNTGPGTSAGEKQITHSVKILVVYFMSSNDPDGDTLFAGIMDGIMDALRTSFPNPAILTDPWTGVQTLAANTGEDMTYDLLPPAATKNQRLLLCEGVITVPLLEVIEA
jgi:hypothetical protein